MGLLVEKLDEYVPVLLVDIEESVGLADLGDTTGDSAVFEDVFVGLNEVAEVGNVSGPVTTDV